MLDRTRQIAIVCSAYFGLAYGQSDSRADQIDCHANTENIVRCATIALKQDWAADPLFGYIEKDEVQRGEKLTSKSYAVVMLDGSEYRMPIAIDDHPLSPERRNIELSKLKRELERRRNESASARQSRLQSWRKQHDDSGELLLDFPGVLTFALVGEEIKDGHDSYLLAAKPRAGVVPTTRAQKVLTGIQGKVWVDKVGMHPFRIECSVVKAVPVYGVLASVLPGTEIDITMTPVADSIWLIDLVAMKLKVEKLHMLKSTQVTRSVYTEYKPNADVVEQLLGVPW